MLAGLGRLIHRRRWTSLALILLMTVCAGGWGLGVFAKFKQGGFEDPKASSTLVAKLGATYFGSTNPDILVLYRSDTLTVDDPQYMANVLGTVSRLPKSQVEEVISYWSFDRPQDSEAFASRDKHSTFVSLKIRAKDDITRVKIYEDIKDRLNAPGMNARLGGMIPLGVEFSTQVVTDIIAAETISMPILLILLIIVFGALTAAVLPLVVALFSIVGGLAVLHVITYVTDVTATALEVVTMMGVGLAIDYSLFIVSRFREEIARDGDRQRALAATMATAGRTIAVSGITVTAALSGLLLFPQMFLRTIGLAGMATVMVAVFGAVVLLPTLLALLGPKVEFGRMPWRRRRAARRDKNPESGFWYRLGHSVMKHPFPYFVVTLGILAVLFGPFLNVQFGAVDARVLPKDSPTRNVVETVKAEFPNGSAEPIDVVISGDLIPRNWRPVKKNDTIPPYLEGFRKRLGELPHVVDAKFTGYSGDYGGVRVSVTHDLEPMSNQAQSLVQTIRQMSLDKDGFPMHIDVGGSTAAQLDLMSSLMKTLPKMALLVGTTTFILLFMFFGSILLPIKAIVMNVLSIGASFGVVVWGFQYGHLAGLLDFTPTGGVEATTMIMILATVFGLSMDYEVFLLSRIREEWDRTHDNRTAVAVGMQRTGSIITAAALLFLVVIGAFGMAGITVVKLIGVGMFVAVVVDAVLVRSLLVPATMRFMGNANWWLPGPLAGLHAKMDLRERDLADHAPPTPAPTPTSPASRPPGYPPTPTPYEQPAPAHGAPVSYGQAAPAHGAPVSHGQAAPPESAPVSYGESAPTHGAPAQYGQPAPTHGVPASYGQAGYGEPAPAEPASYKQRGGHAQPASPGGASGHDAPGSYGHRGGRGEFEQAPVFAPPGYTQPGSGEQGSAPYMPPWDSAPAGNGQPEPVGNGRWSPWADGQPEPRAASVPRTTRKIVPNPDGPGWHWMTVEDDDAS